jgi:hypothetical protein
MMHQLMECDRFVARTHRVVSRVDTKDYPEGMWTLPPTYRLKDQDREKLRERSLCAVIFDGRRREVNALNLAWQECFA